MPLESDEAYGARIMAGVVCDGCGAPDLTGGRIDPGQEAETFDDLSAISRGRGARGWRADCAWAPSKNTAGSAHRAITPAASQRAGWAGTHNQEHIT